QCVDSPHSLTNHHIHNSNGGAMNRTLLIIASLVVAVAAGQLFTGTTYADVPNCYGYCNCNGATCPSFGPCGSAFCNACIEPEGYPRCSASCKYLDCQQHWQPTSCQTFCCTYQTCAF